MTTASVDRHFVIRTRRWCAAIAAAGAFWWGFAAADGPPPHITIAIPMPQASLGQGGPNVAEPLRQGLMTRLRAAAVEVVPLDAADPQQLDAEALAKHATFVLYAHLEQKHAGGLGGMLHKLAPFASALPMLGGRGGGLGSLASSTLAQGAASSVASSAQQQMLSQLSGVQQSNIKNGDTLTLEYRLVAPGSATPAGAASVQGKASVDGEDVLGPLVERVANSVVASAQGTGAPGAAASSATAPNPPATAADAPSGSGHSFLGGLFGRKGGAPSNPPPGAGATPDCAQIAAIPGAAMNLETCQKMLAAKQQYDAAATDPRGMHAGDEALSCEQLVAEFKQQNITAPDKATAAQGLAAVTKERSMLADEQATMARTVAVQQAAVSAAAASDRATMLATGGVVDPNRAGKLAEVFQDQNRATGERWNAERRPTEVKMNSATADLAGGAAQQAAANPRLARLMQLMNAKRCKASS